MAARATGCIDTVRGLGRPLGSLVRASKCSSTRDRSPRPLLEGSGGGTASFADETQQEMLGVDPRVVVPPRGELGLQQRFPRQTTKLSPATARGNGRAASPGLPEPARSFGTDQERFQQPAGDALTLAHDAQQEVLGARHRIAETSGPLIPRSMTLVRAWVKRGSPA